MKTKSTSKGKSTVKSASTTKMPDIELGDHELAKITGGVSTGAAAGSPLSATSKPAKSKYIGETEKNL